MQFSNVQDKKPNAFDNTKSERVRNSSPSFTVFPLQRIFSRHVCRDVTQISVATVLTNACKTQEQQNILAGHGAVRALAGLLAVPHQDVQLPALKCLAYMVFGNEEVRQS